MPLVRVAAFSLSIDGFGAGPDQSLENPMGAGGMALHEWFFGTQYFQSMTGKTGPIDPVNDAFAKRSFENVGAWILGRNMFGPIRGPWPNDDWKGWWGDEPPYHCDVFVLTHHARAPLTLSDTTFHFITEGPEEALRRAKASAGGKDVRIGGGSSTVRQYLLLNAIDEMHLVIGPAVLGRGERPLDGIDLNALGFRTTEYVTTPKATHVVLQRG